MPRAPMRSRCIAACYYEAMLTKTCECCGREFTRADFTYYVNPAAFARKRFCSRSCRSKAVNRGVPRPQPTGPDSPRWKGDAVTPQAGRKRARAIFGKPTCSVCGALGEIHHKDGNPVNNSTDNVEFLCRQHHVAAHEHWGRRPKFTPEEQREKQRAYSKAWYERNRERVLAANREKYRRRKEAGG